MFAVASFAQQVVGAAAHHVDAVIDEALDGVDDAELARLSTDDGEHDDAEIDLELSELVEVVKDDLGLLAALEFVNDPHAFAVAVVVDVRDAFDLLFVDQTGGVLDEPGLVDLIGKLGDDDGLLVFADGFNGRLAAQLDGAATGLKVVDDTVLAKNDTARGEVRPEDDLADVLERSVGVLDQLDGGGDDLAQIVGRDVGSHTDGNAR